MAETETSNGGLVAEDPNAKCIKDWGFDLKETYRHALKFYKGENGENVVEKLAYYHYIAFQKTKERLSN